MKKGLIIFIVGLFIVIYSTATELAFQTDTKKLDKKFKIISSVSNKDFHNQLLEFANTNKIQLEIEYYGDLEIVDKLNEEADYDAVWISNSMWLYMLDNQYLVSNSKSIGISPVVFGIKKSKADQLGFVDKEIYNRDILNAIKNGQLKYVMPSVTKTNSGATAYLGFLNNLAGSPEVLTTDMLRQEQLISDMASFFKGVERVSGDEDYTISMFKNGDYDAIISYESSLIKLNKELIAEGSETLYLVYPIDGVAINDMPFGFIDRNRNKLEDFEKIQKFLLSDSTKLKLEQLGKRTWYGGIKPSADKESFDPAWGIDTNKYLIPLKYPSKSVMTDAFNIYVEEFRKPNHTVFCLDVSGSMTGGGLEELKEAMNYILTHDEAAKDRVQFSKKDKVSIITFNDKPILPGITKKGLEIESLNASIKKLRTGGMTNIYDSSVEALKILKQEDPDEYTTVVILMTDGFSNNGNYNTTYDYVKSNSLNIPIYSIMFGSSDESQLNSLATLTNGKVFDGKEGLRQAFIEVRGYN